VHLGTTPAVVCYLDLLGFSNRMMALRDSPESLAALQFSFNALKYSCDAAIGKYCDDETRIWWSSDSCALQRFFEENSDESAIKDAISSVVSGAGIVQCFLATESGGYFVRGAITADRMYNKSAEEEPSGPALTWAVQLEKESAGHPCIIVHEYVYGFAADLVCNKNQREIFVFDAEMPFLDYLSFSEYVNPNNPIAPIAWHAEEVHKFVTSVKSVPKLTKKARWLHWYHDWHIRSRGDLETLLLKIDPP